MMKIDTHVHTEYSPDSETTIEEAIEAAKIAGLNGIAITDHNTVDGVKEAFDLVEEDDFLIIPGIEVSSKDGHILGLGIEEDIPSELSVEETVARIREKEGIAISAHPFSLSSKPFSPLKSDFDAIESFNSKRYIGTSIATRYAQINDLSQTGGSDAHFPEEIGLAGIELDCKPFVREVIEKIREGKASIFGRFLPPTAYLRRALK